MTQTYLDWIDTEIHRHQTEIARLTVARSVIEEASDKLKRVAPKLLAKPTKKQRGPYVKGRTRDLIVDAMAALSRGVKPKEIAEVIIASHPDVTEKAIWNALYNARIKGHVLRDGQLYSLPVTEEKAA